MLFGLVTVTAILYVVFVLMVSGKPLITILPSMELLLPVWQDAQLSHLAHLCILNQKKQAAFLSWQAQESL
ncbi:MAG: hypothetical protein IPJ13_19230 [Saprospiraceae bacterium]|nr:hypothetical protein [Saprospiraceae bacterium]